MTHKRHHEPEHHHPDHEDEKILREVRENHRLLVEILHLVKPHPEQPATTFEVVQLSISGDSQMAKAKDKATFPGPVAGVPAGGTGTFGISAVGADGNPGLLAPGTQPSYAVDDSAVTFTASSDGSSVQVAVPATDTNASFNLTVSGTSSSGAAISTVFNIPILAAAPPPEQAATLIKSP